jgi:ribosome-associated protein
LPLAATGASTLNSDTAHDAPVSETSASEDDQRLPAGQLEELILTRLDEDKAEDVVFIDLKDKSSVADAMIVASGRSQRHVGALADHLLRALKEQGHGRCRVEGLPHCDWVLIDAGDVIIHIFRPEVRSFYNIEKIWSVDSAHRTPAAH